MFKQIYRFLSILIISNLLLNPAVLAKTQENADNSNVAANACQVKHKNSIIEKLFGSKKSNPQTTDKPNPIIQNHDYNGPEFITKYGVYLPDNVYNTYPSKK